MKITTKKGDSGRTDLLTGQRISKADPRAEAYGTIDEASSEIGAARSACRSERVKEELLRIQRLLFKVAAEIASDGRDKGESHVSEEDLEKIDDSMEGMEKLVRMPDGFIVPGDTHASAHIDVARAVIRRAERRTVALKEEGRFDNETVLKILNRLSDFLWLLARAEEQTAPDGTRS